MPPGSPRDGRPRPEALLKAATAEARGRLRIFLGAAPGVGKTWEMLAAARARRAEGVDVVAGLVETHGRADTAALLEGLEVLPRRRLLRGAIAVEEMDLDALLARRPALALVDELAHTNATDDAGHGSRHPKRYLDVLELLDAGIDVWTTLNVQHIESLNDSVAALTGVRVRETVPDGIIDRADEVELIDITPEDLLQRLRAGHVYLPATAHRAMAGFFTPRNLTALRELALRRTAQRVDTELRDHLQEHAIGGPWAAGTRILVCIAPDAAAEPLVRHGRQMAGLHGAPWIVLHIETAADLRREAAAHTALDAAMRLAAHLGAETVRLPGQAIAADILAHAREHNVTDILIGAAGPRPWWRAWRRPLLDDLVAAAGDLPIHVMPRPGTPAPRRPADGPRRPSAPPRASGREHLAAAALVAGATLVSLVLHELLDVANIALVFLTAVLAAAVAGGLLPSLLAAALSVIAFNFFFLPPLYTLVIADRENVVTLFFFAVVAVIASNLAASVRAQAIAARARGRTTEALYGFSRKLAGIAALDDLLWAIAYQIAAMLRLHVIVLLPGADGLAPRVGYPPDDHLAEADLAAAGWCHAHGKPTGRGADTLPGARWRFLPLVTSRGVLGVLGLDRDDPGSDAAALLTPEQERLLDALADQAAVSIERVLLAADLDRTRLAAEADRMRAALLTSVSHDLRTPLATIQGAAETLQNYGATLAPEARSEMLAAIHEEAGRMAGFVANLLDMTRIEAQAVAPRAEAVDLGEAIGSAIARAAPLLARHNVVTDIAPGLPLPRLDPVLFEQVLFNLLDNAARYTPPGSTITLAAGLGDGRLVVRVIDEGPGFSPATLAGLFVPFHRGDHTDGRPPGTGLGLAICRGFMRAMGGDIIATNRTDHGGACFTLTLGLPE